MSCFSVYGLFNQRGFPNVGVLCKTEHFDDVYDVLNNMDCVVDVDYGHTTTGFVIMTVHLNSFSIPLGKGRGLFKNQLDKPLGVSYFGLVNTEDQQNLIVRPYVEEIHRTLKDLFSDLCKDEESENA